MSTEAQQAEGEREAYNEANELALGRAYRAIAIDRPWLARDDFEAAYRAALAANVPAGWKFDVSFSDGRAWLQITTPQGASATLSAAHKTGNGDDTIAAQVLDYLRDALAERGAA